MINNLLPTSCNWCPRKCGANRRAGERGWCGAADKLRIARCALHYWEEPPISGEAGSGTIFFSYCPLRCGYCQNHSIALGDAGADVSFERLVEMMHEQQHRGALNINLVTPTHYAPIIAAAVRRARSEGMNLPVAWNTSGYETVEAIQQLSDVVDIFLTDFKYVSSDIAQAYSHAADYPQVAFAALDQMVAQVGDFAGDQVDGQPRMTRGVIVRHLLLPGHLEESLMVVQALHNRYGNKILLSLMNQYTPVLDAGSSLARQYPQLLAKSDPEDYDELLEFADDLGIEDYFWQDGAAATESFIPAFDLQGVLNA